MPRTFDELIAEAEAEPVAGWDFGWLAGRATEQRPSWGYSRLLAERMATARVALDLQTGGGEVLAGLPRLAPVTVATEAWQPNVVKADRLLVPAGAFVLAADEQPPLPLRTASFDLVVSRHPVQAHWDEIARVLAPGGRYFAQHVGPSSVFELIEYFLGEQPGELRQARHPEQARAGAEAAGLTVLDLRAERLRMEFFDIGAVVYLLRKVIWLVPDFSVERFRDRLRSLHDQIEADGSFVAHSSRFLIEAAAPG